MAFTIEPGMKAPDFALKGVDGNIHSFKDFNQFPVLVIMFTCNHCPYVIGSEERMIEFHNDYIGKGVALVGINSNDSKAYPDDSFDNMVLRVKEKGFTWPYLIDETQEVAQHYGAIKTPHFFVIDKDRVIRYTGRIDDNPRNQGKETTHELRDAVDAVLTDRQVKVMITDPIGCTIKWKGKDSHWIPADICDFQLTEGVDVTQD